MKLKRVSRDDGQDGNPDGSTAKKKSEKKKRGLLSVSQCQGLGGIYWGGKGK